MKRARRPVCLLTVWFVANVLIVGLVSALAGGWYLGWTSMPLRITAELGLIQLPNLLLPVWVLRRDGARSWGDLREALGWRWTGRRTLGAGIGASVLYFGLNAGGNGLLGASIPYYLPGEGGIFADRLLVLLGLLLFLLVFVGLTTVAEETMFRGLIQTQLAAAYGAPVGILGAALLFGLRHLPADLFYASVWNATPQMWLSRQLQLYGGALLFGLARHVGRSTYASWMMHVFIFGSILFASG